jgi:aspartate/methionine/tyrosine aminotransferase
MFSMSKTYGMAGWRLGFVVGNAEIVARLDLLADHVRAGVFRPVQEAGIAALTGPQGSVAERVRRYGSRRDRALATLRAAGIEPPSCDGSFFVWFRAPDGLTAERVLAERRVALAPGGGFGAQGAGWLRLSLTVPDEALDLGLERLALALR